MNPPPISLACTTALDATKRYSRFQDQTDAQFDAIMGPRSAKRSGITRVLNLQEVAWLYVRARLFYDPRAREGRTPRRRPFTHRARTVGRAVFGAYENHPWY